ncbi:FAD-dependent oxidoreductase [Microbacterium ulmi]|uniref:FAD-dependent oxidoreductase n=1 Tax=Microbacterium ulmi TaxID=179095 RepID=A0A7Y2PYX0_9MICO|nr:FAD-dependent oxidoreductase [Microbacterium ulmi]NII69901.1 glycine/D-amino acid oxidase-like deaminating enzyme/nitrite reductase/ring-hydroxylating ferredoxin subunit [Microbacterium ulmi]NNH03821.1 FAD-dependent oxidoreductase [Microbacterium ulmi]
MSRDHDPASGPDAEHAWVPDRPRSLWAQTWGGVAVDPDPPARADVVIAGGGLTGIAAALALTRLGRRVVVVEARSVGAVTTGRTTGKLSLLQGGTLGRVRARSGDDGLRAYVAANRAAQDWLAAEIGDDPDAAQQRIACTFATTSQGDAVIERELDAMRVAGIPAQPADRDLLGALALPFPVSSAVVLAGQWQLHPLRVLTRLADQVRARGGRIVEGCRVVSARPTEGGVEVQTTRGAIGCASLVLATGTPVLDRGLFFAKLEPSRSLVGVYGLPPGTPPPTGMFLSADERSRSLRTARGPRGQEVLLVGSPAFSPGRASSTREILDELDAWTSTAFPGARRTSWWGAQDYRPVSGRPFAGRMPRGAGRIFAATGYDKWGMTNAVAAALAVTAELTGEPATTHARSRGVVARTLAVNAGVAGQFVAGWARATTRARAHDRPPEGTGRLTREGVHPAAESTIDGVTCRVSGICTHLGGVLQWNDAERSWDCPLHGSRFTPDGDVLEGPAVRPLARRD